jgi:hypothetical protein
MGHTIFFGAGVNDLGQDPAFGDLHDCIRASLARLSADPVGSSVRSDSPLIPTGQMFVFGCESQAEKYEFRVYFTYGLEENSLHVRAFTHHRMR